MRKRYWIGGTIAGLFVIGSVAGGNDGSDEAVDKNTDTTVSSTTKATPSSSAATPTPAAEPSTPAPIAEPGSYSRDDVLKRVRKAGFPALKNSPQLNESIIDSCHTIDNRPLTGPVVQEDRRSWLAANVAEDTSRADVNRFVDALYQACRDLGYSAVWVKPLTVSQEQAVGAAEDYLEYSAFSRDGLIDQLSSDYGSGFSVSDATFAVDHIEVDWSQQAVKAAKEYLEYSNFSRSGLIEQLSSDYGGQFTYEQAVFGVNKVGL